MPKTASDRRKPVTALAVVVLASLALAACGGSSSGNTASTASAATSARAATTASAITTAAPASTATGTTTPTTQGATGSTAGHSAPSVAAALATGASASLALAIRRCVEKKGAKKCGVSSSELRSAEAAKGPAGEHALAKFAACLRARGVDVSGASRGGGSGANTAAPAFKVAESQCRAALLGGAKAP